MIGIEQATGGERPGIVPDILPLPLALSTLEGVLGPQRTEQAMAVLPGLAPKRPWPAHRLDERLVDFEYIPSVPVKDPADMWEMRITDDHTVQLPHRSFNALGPFRIAAINLALLTREGPVSYQQLQKLAAIAINRAFGTDSLSHAYYELDKRYHPYKLFDTITSPGTRGYRKMLQLASSLRVEDDRVLRSDQYRQVTDGRMWCAKCAACVGICEDTGQLGSKAA